jgi:hypothetical protein
LNLNLRLHALRGGGISGRWSNPIKATVSSKVRTIGDSAGASMVVLRWASAAHIMGHALTHCRAIWLSAQRPCGTIAS